MSARSKIFLGILESSGTSIEAFGCELSRTVALYTLVYTVGRHLKNNTFGLIVQTLQNYQQTLNQSY